MEEKFVVAMAVVAGAVMVGISISPGGRAEVRGTEPMVSPLGIEVSTRPPIVVAGVGIAGLTTSGKSENPESALFAGASPPNEIGLLSI